MKRRKCMLINSDRKKVSGCSGWEQGIAKVHTETFRGDGFMSLYLHMSNIIKSYALNMGSFLYVNITSLKLLNKKKLPQVDTTTAGILYIFNVTLLCDMIKLLHNLCGILFFNSNEDKSSRNTDALLENTFLGATRRGKFWTLALTECPDSSGFVLFYLLFALVPMLLSHLACNVPIAEPKLSPTWKSRLPTHHQEAFPVKLRMEKNDLPLDKVILIHGPSPSTNLQILSTISSLALQLLPAVGLSARVLLQL